MKKKNQSWKIDGIYEMSLLLSDVLYHPESGGTAAYIIARISKEFEDFAKLSERLVRRKVKQIHNSSDKQLFTKINVIVTWPKHIIPKNYKGKNTTIKMRIYSNSKNLLSAYKTAEVHIKEEITNETSTYDYESQSIYKIHDSRKRTKIPVGTFVGSSREIDLPF